MEPVAWHASLPGVVMAAGALINDGDGGIMLVKPNYRDHWTLPGGICEFGEPPHVGCSREISEELGLDLPIGPLLAIDWQLPLAAYGTDARPAVYFVFDCGTLNGRANITLQQEELDEWRFIDPNDMAAYLPPQMLPRAVAAVAAKAAGTTFYVPVKQQADAPGAS